MCEGGRHCAQGRDDDVGYAAFTHYDTDARSIRDTNDDDSIIWAPNRVVQPAFTDRLGLAVERALECIACGEEQKLSPAIEKVVKLLPEKKCPILGVRLRLRAPTLVRPVRPIPRAVK